MPPPVDGGIAAYLDGMCRSRLGERYELAMFDVRLPRFFRRHRRWRPFLTLRFALGLTLRLAARRPDLVHIHTSDFASFWEKSLFGALARLFGCRYLLHLHGASYESFVQGLSPLGARIAARSLRGAACVIVLSEQARAGRLAQLAGCERLTVLANAVHQRDFAGVPVVRAEGASTDPSPGRDLRLLFVGTLCSDKGLDDLLQALREVRTGGCTNFQLDLVGDEERPRERVRYERLVRDTGLEGHVRFRGKVVGEEKIDLLRRADLFVLPSRRESFGIANLEAMASGLAIVSTRTGAIPEYLTDGVEGLLVEPGDAGALAAALRRLLSDAELRRRLGTAARRRVRELDWSLAAERLGQVYERALGRRGLPAAGPPTVTAANP